MKLCAILLLLLIPVSAVAEGVPFKVCLLTYHTSAFADYYTTLHASNSFRYNEENPITKIYWRSKPAFCFAKCVETVLFDTVFKWVYKKNKFLGYLTVISCTIVRYLAYRGNMRALQ